MNLHEIRNYIALGERYGTSGQPTEEQLRAIADHGFRVVVNLAVLDPKFHSLADEASSVTALGMAYHHIPVDFRNPTRADFTRFLEIMRAARERVFVHCAANYRVSCFMALFGASDLGWSAERAEAHFRALWSPNEVWTKFFEEMRAAAR